MMKRILIVSMALMLVLSFAGCSGGGSAKYDGTGMSFEYSDKWKESADATQMYATVAQSLPGAEMVGFTRESVGKAFVAMLIPMAEGMDADMVAQAMGATGGEAKTYGANEMQVSEIDAAGQKVTTAYFASGDKVAIFMIVGGVDASVEKALGSFVIK